MPRHHYLHSLFGFALLGTLLVQKHHVAAQSVQCATVAGGCDAGTSHDVALKSAISRFQDDKYYGGRPEIVLSSVLSSAGAQAMITYACEDGSVPPLMGGNAIRESVLKILSCPNQCGGIAVSNGAKCGLGVLVASNAAGDRCFSLATNVTPSPAALSVTPSVGDYKSPACYTDSSTARLLTGGSITDVSRMSVRQCVEKAAEDGWAFAGLEAGGQCFYGDEKTGDPKALTLTDCNTPCPGDGDAVCGGDNKILVYRGPDPVLLTLPEAVAELEKFEALLLDFLNAMKAWEKAIKDYENARVSLGSKRRHTSGEIVARQDTAVLVPYFQEVERRAETVKQVAEQRKNLFGKDKLELYMKILRRWQKIQTAQYQKFATDIITPLAQVEATVASVSVSIPSVGAPATSILSILSGLFGTIGVPQALSAIGALGIFLAISQLVKALQPGTQDPEPTQPPQTTSIATTSTSTTTTTTSSRCTATATQTPIIILTKQGTTKAQFDQLVKDLPKHKDNIEFTPSLSSNWMYVAMLDQCTSEKLNVNPIVEAWSIDADLYVEDNTSGGLLQRSETAPLPRKERRRTPPPSSEPASAGLEDVRNGTQSEAEISPIVRARNVPVSGSRFRMQRNSPDHLYWLAAMPQYTKLGANGAESLVYGFDGPVFDDPEPPTLVPSRPLLYVIDTGFFPNHPAYAGSLFDSIAVNAQGNQVAQTAAPTSHGTCMASLAAGNYSSMGRHARLVTVQMNLSPQPVIVPGPTPGGSMFTYGRASLAMFTFERIIEHLQQNGGVRNAVVSMSFAVGKQQQRWPGNTTPSNRDVFEIMLERLDALGVVVVCSAGNDQDKNIDARFKELEYLIPRGHGGRNTNLIVVGNAQYDNTRYVTSQFLDSNNRGILSLYNMGTEVDCALLGGGYGLEPPGTSQATASTAGMAAYYLSLQHYRTRFLQDSQGVPHAVKEHLRAMGTNYKGAGIAHTSGPGPVPLAALGEVVPCLDFDVTAPPGPPVRAQTATTPTTPRALDVEDLTSGQNVVFAPLPSCYFYLPF